MTTKTNHNTQRDSDLMYTLTLIGKLSMAILNKLGKYVYLFTEKCKHANDSTIKFTSSELGTHLTLYAFMFVPLLFALETTRQFDMYEAVTLYPELYTIDKSSLGDGLHTFKRIQ